jgi:hypothetical protein
MKELSKVFSLMWRESHKKYDLERYDPLVRNDYVNDVGIFIEDVIHRRILNRIMFVIESYLGEQEFNEFRVEFTMKQLEAAWNKL